ncbi:MAG: hypothetical protein H6644_01425 [Caldilineaceae bacterium]|nr:hypothetical protein [Caldilineaceae bacterium]
MVKVDLPGARMPATDGDGNHHAHGDGQSPAALGQTNRRHQRDHDVDASLCSELPTSNRTVRTATATPVADGAGALAGGRRRRGHQRGRAGAAAGGAQRGAAAAGLVVLRGVGCAGGVYTDTPDIIPYTGAATTEIRGVHSHLHSDVFYPIRPWEILNFAREPTARAGHQSHMRGQHRIDPAAPITGTWRRFTEFDFRLFYSGNVTGAGNPDGDGDIVPARAAPPTIVRIASGIGDDGVTFSAQVTGHPAAGIQQVWVTYTSVRGGQPVGTDAGSRWIWPRTGRTPRAGATTGAERRQPGGRALHGAGGQWRGAW